MQKSVFITLFLSLILISCKEKEETFKLTVKGKVVDYYTGDGIANATVFVKGDRVIDPSKEQLRQLYYCFFDSTYYIKKIKSDSSGNFDESFWQERGSFYIVVYDYKVISTEVFCINQDSIKFLNIRARKFKSLTINFVNKTKYYDTLLLDINSPQLNKYPDRLHQYYEIIGMKDTIIVYKEAIPESTCYLSYSTKKYPILHKQIEKEIGISDTSKLIIEY